MTFVADPDALAFAEQRRADAHARGAEADGGLEVCAHSHRPAAKAVARRELGGLREARAGRPVGRPNAHHALERQAELVAAAGDEGVRFTGDDAGLLRLLAGVDLDVEARAAARPRRLAGQRLRQLRPVERLDE